jgi:hypothetical protein
MSLGLAHLDGWHVLNHTLVAITTGWEEQCEENKTKKRKFPMLWVWILWIWFCGATFLSIIMILPPIRNRLSMYKNNHWCFNCKRVLPFIFLQPNKYFE